MADLGSKKSMVHFDQPGMIMDYLGLSWIIMYDHGFLWFFMDFDEKLSSTRDLNGLVASPPIPRRQIQQTKAGAPSAAESVSSPQSSGAP
jgi:hypothetical protein